MGHYRYINPKQIIPSQNFLKDDTVRMIVDALASGQVSCLPPPPLVRTVSFSPRLVAIDGHNLLAVKLLLGENCLVYVTDDHDDTLPTFTPNGGVNQRNKELKEKFDISESEARHLYKSGVTGLEFILANYPDLVDYTRTLLFPQLTSDIIGHDNIKKAFVHGRFQPFHHQHFEYILSAKQLCDFLYIGITRSDPISISESLVAPHRADPAANLLTYYERMEMISRCLLSEGFDRAEFGFVPIPIDKPEYLAYFMDTNVKCYTTTCDDWNLHKIAVLQEMGYDVESLIDRRDNQLLNTHISGSMIREMLLNNDKTWMTMVSPVVAEYLTTIGYQNRLFHCCRN